MTNCGKPRKSFPAIILALVLLGASCGSDDAEPEPQQTASGASGETPGVQNLADVCPDPIVIQNSWIPQATEGFFYSLIPLEQAEFDPTTGTVSGPAAADPNATIEIRAGGPAIGFQSVISELYAKPEILIGLNQMDSMIEVSDKFPTKAVFSPYVKHPFALMYGEDAFPQGIESFDDVRATGETVLSAEGQTWVPALVSLGELDADQVDYSYDFSPARFLEAQGKIFQGAFGNIDRLAYEEDIPEWGGGPIGLIYGADGGYPNVRAVFARPEVVTEWSECLKLLVPAMQQSLIDYVGNPQPLNEAIFDWMEQMEQFAYSVDASVESIAADQADGLIGNGPSGYVGEMDPAGVARLLEIDIPLFEDQGARVDPNLTPEDIYTNEFLDQSLAFETAN